MKINTNTKTNLCFVAERLVQQERKREKGFYLLFVALLAFLCVITFFAGDRFDSNGSSVSNTNNDNDVDNDVDTDTSIISDNGMTYLSNEVVSAGAVLKSRGQDDPNPVGSRFLKANARMHIDCLKLESLYHPDDMGVISADIVLDRKVLSDYTCLESSVVKKVEGNIEIGPSKFLTNIQLSGLEIVVGSLAVIGVSNSRSILTFDACDLREVHEFLQIRYTDLRTLEIPNLVMVGRTLELKDNPYIESFDFPLLQLVGLHLIVQDNPVLQTIYLPSLVQIRWDLWIQYNTQLKTINAPELLTIGEDYELHYCGSLVNINHPKLRFIGEDLEVYSLLSLKVFNLPKLNYIGEDLEFDNCPMLEVIDLPELVRMDEDFTLSSLPNLKDLNMDALVEIGEDFEFILVGLPVLSLASLHTIESDTLLTDMPHLQSINLPNIVIMEGAIEMNGLPLLSTFELPVEVIGSNPNKEDEEGRRNLAASKKTDMEDEEEEEEAEIDQRFYITGCDTLQKISLPNLKNITADTMLIFGLPKLKTVFLPNLNRYMAEEEDPDGLELFSIATNPFLDNIVLSSDLNEPKLYSFVDNAILCPNQGPQWAIDCTVGQLPPINVTDLFFQSLCPNDDDHHTESDWERQFCIEYNCPEEASVVTKEGNMQCISLGDIYESSNGIINGSVFITRSDVNCITCDGIQQVDGCITISNNLNLNSIQCNFLEVVTGSIILRNNPSLSNLSIENVYEIGGIGLYIVANSIAMVQLPRIVSINTIHIASNSLLTNIEFNSLNHTIQHLHIDTNPSLIDIQVPSLVAIGVGEGDAGDLHLMGNTAMQRYSFPKLELVGEDIEMFYSPWLTEIDFSLLVDVLEDFEVYYFLSLPYVEFPKLNMTGEDLEIWDLVSVRRISLPSFTQVGEDFEVFDCLLLQELSIPALDTVEEDFDVYCNRELTFLEAPNLQHIWEDISLFGNDHLVEVSFPSLEDIAFVEGGGFLITTNRVLKELAFPALQRIGKDRGENAPSTDGPGEFGYDYPGRDGDEALYLYSGVSPVPFIVNRNRPFMICDNPSLGIIDMPKLESMDSGGLFVEANSELRQINLDALEILGNTSYFIVRHNHIMRQDSLRIGELTTDSASADPILSNLDCNTPQFCVKSPAPIWVDPYICPTTTLTTITSSYSGSIYSRNRDMNKLPRYCSGDDPTFPSELCNSTLSCTDAYYLWARENDYDFEENVVQINGPPQFSAVEWKRKERTTSNVKSTKKTKNIKKCKKKKRKGSKNSRNCITNRKHKKKKNNNISNRNN